MLVVLKVANALRFKQKNWPFEVLNQPSQFSNVLRTRQRVQLHPEARFLEIFYQRHTTNQSLFRVGMVVSKRVAPNAVTRNMLKRQWREVFRSFCLASSVCVSADSGTGAAKDESAPDQLSCKTSHPENGFIEAPATVKATTFDVVLRAKPALKTAYQAAKRDKKLSALRQQIRLETQASLEKLASLA